MKTRNSIGYCGIAKVKKMLGKTVIEEKIYHNNGTNYLFQALASTLCGYDRTADMPKFFDMGRTTEEGDVYTCFLANRAYLTSKVVLDYKVTENSTVSVAALFTAYIPSRTVLNTDLNVNTFALYSQYSFGDNNTSRLATINLPSEVEFTLDSSAEYSYIVEWAMTFDNINTSDE